MEINLTELKKIFVHSSELAKTVEKALIGNAISVPEATKLKSMFHQMQLQASTMEMQLEQLNNQYKLDETSAKQQLWERKLLDLTLRNNLLNMREGKNIIPYNCDNIATLEDNLSDGTEVVWEKKELQQIYRTMRTNMEETGANTLFLTLGTLNWYELDEESKDSEKKMYKAPILLMPVEIIPLSKGRYAITKRDDDIIVNITLLEFLRQNYDIVIPNLNPLPQDAHGLDVNLIMHTVGASIKDMPGWTIVEDSYLGIFSFTKFVMWNDIHTHSAEIMQHDIVRSFVEGRLLTEDNIPAADARQLDMETRPDAYSIPVDVDSSQLEAIIDAGNGKSFVLYGPPGTGKSQSITNIIANALHKNKRVLFVAEKKQRLKLCKSVCLI